MEANVGSNVVAPPTSDAPVIGSDTPLEQHMTRYSFCEQHMPGSTQGATDGKRDPIAHFEAIFPGSSHVTSTRTLQITFLVDDDHFPMKLEKLPGI